MAFDDCPPARSPDEGDPKAMGAFRQRLEIAVDRTTDWLKRCIESHARADEQSLFGIVQGGPHSDLREASAKAITGIDLPGYAIGGVATGEAPEEIHRIVAKRRRFFPRTSPDISWVWGTSGIWSRLFERGSTCSTAFCPLEMVAMRVLSPDLVICSKCPLQGG